MVTGALELERAEKRIGSSLEAAPRIHIADDALMAAVEAVDFADVCITSQVSLTKEQAPSSAFKLDDVDGIAVDPVRAKGRKCARSWKILPEVGTDQEYPDLTLRDAAAIRELNSLGRWPG